MTDEKMCLCYEPAKDGPYLEHWNTFLVARSVVDDLANPNPAIQQIIPYVTFMRECTIEAEDCAPLESLQLMSYRRGSQGAESRLVAKRSVGFGGHIDSLPGANILEHIHNEVTREIHEELSIDCSSKELYTAIISCIRHGNLLCVRDEPVESVHTGLSILLHIKEHSPLGVMTLEEGHIEDIKWICVEDVENLDEYENWSKIVIKGLADNISNWRNALREREELAAKLAKEAQTNNELLNTAAAANADAISAAPGVVQQASEMVASNDQTCVDINPP